MASDILRLLAAVAAGVVLVALPQLIRRFLLSVRTTRALRDAPRATNVTVERYAAFDARSGPLMPGDSIDERTWDDLHLDAVFQQMDRTASQPGRQILYHMLRRPVLTTDNVGEFDARVRAMERNPAAAALLQAALVKLRDRRAADLEAAFFGELPNRPALWWAFPLLTVAGLVCLVGSVAWPGLLVAWLAVCVMNMIAQVLYRPRVQEFVVAMRELPVFVEVARDMGSVAMPEFKAETDLLRDGAARLRAVRLTTAWLRFDTLGANELAGSLYEYLNLLFLLDLAAFGLTTARLRALRTVSQETFRALGTIDAMQSVSRWRQSLDVWCVPELVPAAKELVTTGMRHPLIDAAVPNDLAVHDASMLITGSNMSGKTTFVRAVGVNAVLATAVATVCATTWSAPAYRVRTSIGQADSLLDGKSYYLAEVESVRRMLTAKTDAAQHLFLLDELFRGTNTGERVAAATATLSWLDRHRDLVVVATHDLAVHRLLGNAFRAYHFREQVAAGSMTFDFKLQPGLSSTQNAIALLEVMEFPPALVAAARELLSGVRSGDLAQAEVTSADRCDARVADSSCEHRARTTLQPAPRAT